MRKFFYKDNIYTEEDLETIYPLMVNDCLEEGDYDDIMTYEDFTNNPEKYLEEASIERQILEDLSSYLSGQDKQLEKEIIPVLYFNYGYTEDVLEEAGVCVADEAEWLIKEYAEKELQEVHDLAQSEIEKAGFKRMNKKDFNKLCYLLTTCDPCAYTDDFIRQYGK